MNQPSVSVVIPAYRAAKTIARALDSVLQQTYPAHQILVIDDGSPDELADAVRPYGDRVHLIRKPNGGAASARNLGIDHATGDLVAFLDADDYWEPVRLERQLEVLQKHPEVGVIAGRYFKEVPGMLRAAPYKAPNGRHDRPLVAGGEEAFALATKVWTSTVLVRREVLGEHRFVSGLEPAEDRDLWVRLVTSAPLYLISEPLATAVEVPGSLSRSSVDLDCSNMLRVVQRHQQLLGPSGLRKWQNRVYRRWAGVHLHQGQPRAALAPAWKRVRGDYLSVQAWAILAKSTLRSVLPG